MMFNVKTGLRGLKTVSARDSHGPKEPKRWVGQGLPGPKTSATYEYMTTTTAAANVISLQHNRQWTRYINHKAFFLQFFCSYHW